MKNIEGSPPGFFCVTNSESAKFSPNFFKDEAILCLLQGESTGAIGL